MLVTWTAIRQLLRDARALVAGDIPQLESAPIENGDLHGTLDEFDEFLEHNELELAWDSLAAFAENVDAPSVFWEKMAQAAGLMGLSRKQQEAVKRAESRFDTHHG